MNRREMLKAALVAPLAVLVKGEKKEKEPEASVAVGCGETLPDRQYVVQIVGAPLFDNNKMRIKGYVIEDET